MAHLARPNMLMNAYASCPQCSASNPQRLSFTWWGGVLGPKILSHVKCQSCGKKYNGKTGRDNTTNIVLYTLVVGVICFVLVLAMFAAFAILKMK